MTSTLLYIGLPILWITVSVMISLLLYKTSDGLFQRVNSTGERKTQLKLTGSIVIACSVFVLLWKATPSLSSQVERDDRSSTLQAQIDRLSAASVESQSDLVQLRDCIENSDARECLSIVDRIENNLTAAKNAPRAK